SRCARCRPASAGGCSRCTASWSPPPPSLLPMDVVREPTLRPRTRRRFASTIVAALALIPIAALAACGAPARTQTLDHEPDLVRIAGRTIPPGFGDSVNAELHRLVAACAAIDPNVSKQPGISAHGDAVTQWALVDGHC